MKLQRFVEYGCTPPAWYGLAYPAWDRHGLICYPIPLNLVVAFWHYGLIWLRTRAASFMANYVMENRLPARREIEGFAAHDMMVFLAPYIEKSGHTWTLKPLEGAEYRSMLIID